MLDLRKKGLASGLPCHSGAGRRETREDSVAGFASVKLLLGQMSG